MGSRRLSASDLMYRQSKASGFLGSVSIVGWRISSSCSRVSRPLSIRVQIFVMLVLMGYWSMRWPGALCNYMRAGCLNGWLGRIRGSTAGIGRISYTSAREYFRRVDK